MNLQRIKSIYATFFDDNRITSSQMAVLQALAFCENYETGECFPGKAYLEKLTHLTNSTIDKACKELKDNLKVITWSKVRSKYSNQLHNKYIFLLPHKEMPTNADRYNQFVEIDLSNDAYPADSRPTPPPTVGLPPPPTVGLPPADKRPLIKNIIKKYNHNRPLRLKRRNQKRKKLLLLLVYMISYFMMTYVS